MSIDENTLAVNFEKYEKLTSRINDENIVCAVTELSTRLATAPHATRESQPGAWPGGLIDCSLRVTALMRSLLSAYGFDVPIESVLKVGLLHDIGKVGDLENDLFIVQDSSWHREKLGEFFKYNENASRMPHASRTLFLLQHFCIRLTHDEFVAISQAHGMSDEQRRFFGDNVPPLALVLRQARETLSRQYTVS